MATRTTTIRVPVVTRERLAALADERGTSVAALLADLARRAELDVMFASEREATRADALNSPVAEEEADWGTTTGDGID